jgi:hypothetical protein
MLNMSKKYNKGGGNWGSHMLNMWLFENYFALRYRGVLTVSL